MLTPDAQISSGKIVVSLRMNIVVLTIFIIRIAEINKITELKSSVVGNNWCWYTPDLVDGQVW